MKVEIRGSGGQDKIRKLIDLLAISREVGDDKQQFGLGEEIRSRNIYLNDSLRDFKNVGVEHVSHPADKGRGKYNKRR